MDYIHMTHKCPKCSFLFDYTIECRVGVAYWDMSERQKMLARIAELEAALRPFAIAAQVLEKKD